MIGQLQASALANASTFQFPADPHPHPHPRPPRPLREHAHPIYQVGRVCLHKGRLAGHLCLEDLCAPTSEEDQVHGGIRMVRCTVHSILGYLGPRNNFHVLQSLAQLPDLRFLLFVPLEHERFLIRRASRMPCSEQGLQPRAETRERAGFPLLLPCKCFKIELMMPGPLRFSRALFRRETLLLFLPSLGLLFLLYSKGRKGDKGAVIDTRQKRSGIRKPHLSLPFLRGSLVRICRRSAKSRRHSAWRVVHSPFISFYWLNWLRPWLWRWLRFRLSRRPCFSSRSCHRRCSILKV